MKKTLLQVAFLLLSIVSFAAYSRSAVPVIDYAEIPVLTTTGNPISSDAVRDAIVSAAQTHKWEIFRSPNQQTLSATHIRGKHTVMVTIPYSVEKFSIQYLNSINMKYGIQERNTGPINPYVQYNSVTSVRVIHPAYNTWVEELLRAIQFELKKL